MARGSGIGDDRNMRHSLLVLVLVGACAPGFVSVPQHDWTIVPAARRAAIDAAYQADLDRTRVELRAAQAAATAPAAVSTHAAPAALVPASNDAWAETMRRYAQREAAALAQVDAANARRARAQREVAAARIAYLTIQLDELRCAHELDRARAIDHSLLGDDTYDTGAYQAQLASVQARWFEAQQRVSSAASALQRVNAELVADKEAYAAIVRMPPAAPGDDAAPLRLGNTSLAAGGDIGFRAHGNKHYLTPPRTAGL